MISVLFCKFPVTISFHFFGYDQGPQQEKQAADLVRSLPGMRLLPFLAFALMLLHKWALRQPSGIQ
jgi:hypothetical protein